MKENNTEQAELSIEQTVETALKKSSYTVHPAVAALNIPLGTKQMLGRMAADIKRRGLNERVLVTADREIVDGLLRFVALVLAGITPTGEHFTVVEDEGDKSLVRRAIQGNLLRRHLTSAQRTLVLAEAKKVGVSIASLDLKSMGTSAETLRRIGRVLRSGDQQVIDDVRTGKLSASKADRVVSGRVPKDDPYVVGDSRSQKKVKAAALKADEDDMIIDEPGPRGRGRPQGDRRKNGVLKACASIEKHISIGKDARAVAKLFATEGEEFDLLENAIASLQSLRDRIAKPHKRRIA